MVPSDDRLAGVYAALEADLDSLTERMVARIREQLPAYQAVDYTDQYDYIRNSVVSMIDAISGRRPLSEEMLEQTRDIGKRRARQGVSLSDVVQTYHLGLQEIWATMLEVAGDARVELLDSTVHTWHNVHLLTTAIADGHSEATSSAQAVRSGLRYRFLEAVTRRTSDDPVELQELAERLGFRPQTEFVAVITNAADWTELAVESYQSTLENVGRAGGQPSAGRVPPRNEAVYRDASKETRRGTRQSTRVADRILTLTQDSSVAAVVAAIHEHQPQAAIGVGMPRPTLAGAAVSIQDAELALLIAQPGSAVDFESAWSTSLLAAHPDQLAPVLADGVVAAREQTHLAEAVLAYAENGFSVSAAARALHLHANSVTYRLDRWRELTGWDARTYDGLLRSVTCLRMSVARRGQATAG